MNQQIALPPALLAAHNLTCSQGRLAGACPALDKFLGGGLPWGKLVEWGLPKGKEGWRVLLPFVAQASRSLPCLWLGDDTDRRPLFPAWFAAGAAPANLYFLASSQPLKEAKEVFTNPWFRFLLLDSPSGLRSEDLAFLAAQARQQGKLILLLRPYFLRPDQGNVWAAMRLNAWKRQPGGPWLLRGVKGVHGDLRLPSLEAT